ncbi:MAG: 2,3,4,5-tetrahydropyridine-2,6-dicarboxylate N-succinyltransferase, partial [Candidatus Pelagibacter sp.]|nr:2,3,4,5-tetrahydropyridine-2,6-dicarboxylate N-succinyltransferase [Candidatus Pelagibacter sp.]
MMELENTINQAWEVKDTISKDSDSKIITAIENTIESLDQGKIRVSEKKGADWVIHEWIKKAILLSFRVNEMEALSGPYSSWYDKAHLIKGKTAGWTKEDHIRAGFRMVPNSPVRKGSFVGKNAVLMPCFINIGAYVDEGTMIDTWSTVGSCAQIGKNCHISGGVGIGGVLEPL